MSYNGIDDEVAIELLNNSECPQLNDIKHDLCFLQIASNVYTHPLPPPRAVVDLRHLESVLLCWNEITAKTMLALDPILPKLRVRDRDTGTISWRYLTPHLASLSTLRDFTSTATSSVLLV